LTLLLAASRGADGPWQHLLYELTGHKWGNLDVENETGCGIVPYNYKRTNVVNAVQWAVGLELMLLINNPWQVSLSTDHPNGGCFWRYPEIIHLLMNADFRKECISKLPDNVKSRITLPEIDREYTLYEIATLISAGPARTLGLNHKEVVGGLALLCPATQPIEDAPDVFKGLDISSAGVRKFIAHTISGPLGLLMEKKIFGVVFAPEPISPDFWVKGGGKLGRSPGAFIAASEDMVSGRDSVEEVAGREAELTMPVGVLYAEADEILDPKLHGEKFAELSGADLKILPNRGHMIPLTAPDDCAAFIRDMAAKSPA